MSCDNYLDAINKPDHDAANGSSASEETEQGKQRQAVGYSRYYITNRLKTQYDNGISQKWQKSTFKKCLTLTDINWLALIDTGTFEYHALRLSATVVLLCVKVTLKS